MVTTNHIHLLVMDIGRNEIPRSMQLVAGRVAQEFNQRKSRKGAFWEDRCHATAVFAETHLARCLTYMDLNMVRAGAVDDPADWPECGYSELMQTKSRYKVLDQATLEALLSVRDLAEMQHLRREWAEESLRQKMLERKPDWSESLAVGDEKYVLGIKKSLGIKGRKRPVIAEGEGYLLWDPESFYGILPPKTAL